MNVENPMIMGNASLMSLFWGMSIPKLIMEDKMQKLFPLQYQMMKDFQVAMEQAYAK